MKGPGNLRLVPGVRLERVRDHTPLCTGDFLPQGGPVLRLGIKNLNLSRKELDSDRLAVVGEHDEPPNRLFQLAHFGLRHRLGGRPFLEEDGCDDIHALVSALGGKNGRDEQLKSVLVDQGTLGLGLVLRQSCRNSSCVIGSRFAAGFGSNPFVR